MGHNSCRGRLHPDQAGPTNTCRRVGIQQSSAYQQTQNERLETDFLYKQAKLLPTYQDIILVILPHFKKWLKKYHLLIILLVI